MEYQTLFHSQTDEEFHKSLLNYAEGQNFMASKSEEDAEYWSFKSIADILLEAAKRLKNDI